MISKGSGNIKFPKIFSKKPKRVKIRGLGDVELNPNGSFKILVYRPYTVTFVYLKGIGRVRLVETHRLYVTRVAKALLKQRRRWRKGKRGLRKGKRGLKRSVKKLLKKGRGLQENKIIEQPRSLRKTKRTKRGRRRTRRGRKGRKGRKGGNVLANAFIHGVGKVQVLKSRFIRVNHLRSASARFKVPGVGILGADRQKMLILVKRKNILPPKVKIDAAKARKPQVKAKKKALKKI